MMAEAMLNFVITISAWSCHRGRRLYGGGKTVYFCIIYGVVVMMSSAMLGSLMCVWYVVYCANMPNTQEHESPFLWFENSGSEFQAPLSIGTPLNLRIHAKIAVLPDQIAETVYNILFLFCFSRFQKNVEIYNACKNLSIENTIWKKNIIINAFEFNNVGRTRYVIVFLFHSNI